MFQVVFWFAWLLFGYTQASTWLDSACPRGGCNFLLVMFQLPGLIGPMFVWLLVGISISVALALVKAMTNAEPQAQAAHRALIDPQLPELNRLATDSELMDHFGISFDGRQYEFMGFRYDRLSDATAYATLAKARDDA